MAITVEKAIYELEYRGLERANQAARAIDGVSEAEGRYARSSRSASDRFNADMQRFERHAAANENIARTFRQVEAAMGGVSGAGKGLATGIENALGIGKLGAFNKEMQAIGLNAPVVTGVLKQTRDGFVQIQNAASDGAVASQTFSSSLDAIGASAEPAGRTASNLVAQLSLLSGAGIVAGALALYKTFKDMTTQIAEMGEVSRRALPDLERFQQVRFAAGTRGVSGEVFDTGVSKVAERLNEARRDTNELTRLLEANNIKYKEGNTLLIDTNRLISIGADLVKRASSERDKFKIAEALGLTKEWVPFLEKGSVAIENAADEASRLGIVIDAGIVKKAGEFDEEWKRSSAYVSAYIRSWLAESIPLVDQFINKGGDWAKAVTDALASAKSGMPDTSQATQGVGELIDGLRKEMNGVKTTTEDAQSALGKIIGRLELFGYTIFDLTPKINVTVDDLGRLRAAFEAVEKAASAGNASEMLREAQRGKALGGLPVGKTTIIPGKEDADKSRDAWDRATESIDKHIARIKADTIAVGMNAGQQATLRAEFTLLEAAKVADKGVTEDQIALYTSLRATMSAQQALAKAGIELGRKETDAFLKKSAAIGEVTKELEQARIASQIKFDFQTAFLSAEDVQIAQQLKRLYPDVATAIKSVEAEQMRWNNTLKQVNDIAGTAASSFVKDLANGVAPMEAFAKAAKSAAESVLDMATKKITSNLLGSLFSSLSDTSGATASATILTTAGATLAAEMVAGATSAAAILAGGGAITATEVAGSGIAAGTALGAGGAVAGGAIATGGTVAGTALWGPIAMLAAAIAAIGALSFFGSGEEDDPAQKAFEEAKQAWAGMSDQVREFNRAADGFELSSFAQALQEIKRTADELIIAATKAQAPTGQLHESFSRQVNNTVLEFAYGSLTELSDLGKKFQDVIVGASQLTDELYALGINLGNAPHLFAIIADGVAKQTEQIRQDYNSQIAARNNTALGKEYINEFSDAVASLNADLKTAALVGGDVAATGVAYANTLQAIVDSNEIAGPAFAELMVQFPAFAGQLHEFVPAAEAAEQAIESLVRSAKDLAQETLALQDRLFAATTDTSTLAGALAAFERTALQERAEEIDAGGELLTLLTQVHEAERQSIITDFANRAIEEERRRADEIIREEERIAEERMRQMETIQRYLDGLRGGSSSTLSPVDRLDAAQSQYQRQLGLARAGDTSAISSITQYAEDYRSAGRDYYGSTMGYQDIFRAIQTDLSALMGSIGGGTSSTSSVVPFSGTATSTLTSSGSTSMGDMIVALQTEIAALRGEVASLKTGVKDAGDKTVAAIAAVHAEEGPNLKRTADAVVEIKNAGTIPGSRAA